MGSGSPVGEQSRAVAVELGAELGLAVPDLPWHTDRRPLLRVGAAVTQLARCVEKVAVDLLLLSQTEVGEVAAAPAPGKGASSAMAHKANQVDAVLARVAARHAVSLGQELAGAPAHELERAAGSWQLEWIVVPELFAALDASLVRLRAGLDGLVVDRAALAANAAAAALGSSDDATRMIDAAIARHRAPQR